MCRFVAWSQIWTNTTWDHLNCTKRKEVQGPSRIFSTMVRWLRDPGKAQLLTDKCHWPKEHQYRESWPSWATTLCIPTIRSQRPNYGSIIKIKAFWHAATSEIEFCLILLLNSPFPHPKHPITQDVHHPLLIKSLKVTMRNIIERHTWNNHIFLFKTFSSSAYKLFQFIPTFDLFLVFYQIPSSRIWKFMHLKDSFSKSRFTW